jgi:hypothetical protein
VSYTENLGFNDSSAQGTHPIHSRKLVPQVS